MRLREDRRTKWWTVVTGFLAFIGIGGLVYMARAFVDQSVERRLTAATEDLQKELNGSLLYLELINFSEETQEGELRRDAVSRFMSLLEELAKHSNVVQRPEFPRYLGNALDVFETVSYHAEVDRIHDLFRDRIRFDDSAVIAMLTEYGERLVASPEPIARSGQDLEKFDYYAQSRGSSEVQGLSLFWRLLVAFRGDSQEELSDWILRVERLDDDGKAVLATAMSVYSHPQTSGIEEEVVHELLLQLLRENSQIAAFWREWKPRVMEDEHPEREQFAQAPGA